MKRWKVEGYDGSRYDLGNEARPNEENRGADAVLSQYPYLLEPVVIRCYIENRFQIRNKPPSKKKEEMTYAVSLISLWGYAAGLLRMIATLRGDKSLTARGSIVSSPDTLHFISDQIALL